MIGDWTRSALAMLLHVARYRWPRITTETTVEALAWETFQDQVGDRAAYPIRVRDHLDAQELFYLHYDPQTDRLTFARYRKETDP